MSEDRRRFVRARYYPSQDRPDFYPELAAESGLAIPWLADRRRHFGVAISGGGTRSASAALGQLRAMAHLGWLDKLGYISTVSGGGWTSTPFVFLPPSYDDRLFLGEAKGPGQLKKEDFLEVIPGSMAWTITEASLIPELIREAWQGAGDETAGRAIGNIFLAPFGLDDHTRLVTFHQDALASALAANHRRPDQPYWLEEGDFYHVRPGRPFLILGTTLTRIENSRLQERRLHAELTPLYCGVRRLFKRAGVGRLPIGGGYVETLGFDSRAPHAVDDRHVYVEIGAARHRFTLSDMMGASGALFRELVDVTGINFLGFAQFRHWPLVDLGQIEEQEYGHGDGALLENLGLMPLLARQVENIVVFVNSETPFDPSEEDLTDRLCGSIEPLFRATPNRDVLGQLTDEVFNLNVVFPENQLQDLVRGLYHCRLRGEPLVYCDTYQVLANEHFNVRPYEAKVVWVYNDLTPRWAEALDPKLQSLLERSELKRFPHFRTTFENSFVPIALEPLQVNALAHLSSFVVLEAAEKIQRFFGF